MLVSEPFIEPHVPASSLTGVVGPRVLCTSGSRRGTISVSIITISEDVPQAPAYDPVIPVGTILHDAPIICRSRLRRSMHVYALYFTVTSCFRDHSRRVWCTNPWIHSGLWCEISTILTCSRPSCSCLFLLRLFSTAALWLRNEALPTMII
jgi:hypothetical protein